MTVYRGWWVVLVSGIGLMLHYGPIISGTFGVFLKELSQEFGWSRAQISLGYSLSTLVLSAAQPIIGRLLDRFGARRVIVPCLLMFGLGVLSFSFLLPKLWHFYTIYVFIGVVGSGTTPVPFSKVISHWFDRRRGIALALIATGSSLGAFVLPPFAQALLDVVRGAFRPNTVIALQDPENPSDVPLLEGRTAIDGRPTAYVCEGFVCQLPVTEPDELRAQLDGS